MKKLRTLIKLYINSIFRFPAIRYSKDPKERRNAIMGIAAIVIIVVTYGGMSGVMTNQMLRLGIAPEMSFLMIAAMASLFSLAMAFAQGSATLSGFADFDTLMGMPIRTSLIVLARFSALYLVEAIYCLAYLLPCGAVYAVLIKPGWQFYPVFLVMTLLLPVAPVVLGSGADLLLSAVFARSKYRKGITSTVKMVFLMGFIVFAYLMPQMSNSFITAPDRTAKIAARIYPPAQWFARGATGNFALAALFIFGSAALCALFLLLLNKTFLPLHDRLTAGYHVRNYRLGALKRSGTMKALFMIERKRFFNSTAWVINTIIGSVLIAAFGIGATAFSGRLSTILRIPAMAGYAGVGITGILIFCATISPTTCCAISMEGKEIWLSKTLPVSAKQWLRAKLLMNLLLVGPSLLLAIVLLAISYGPLLRPAEIAGMILTPVAALLFTTAFGLFVNAKIPRLDWKSDTEVVKQSGAVLIMVLTGFGIVALTVIPTLAIGKTWIMLAVSAALYAATAAVYLYLMKNAEQIRRNL